MEFKELNKALNDFGKYVVQQARSILTKEKKRWWRLVQFYRL